MTENRRSHPRITMPLECAWSGASGRAETRISDLSEAGCYVDTSQVPVAGETVEINVTLGGAALTLSGRVVYAAVGMGFGAKFEPLETATAGHLSAFVSAPR
jgi:hypothetical protein